MVEARLTALGTEVLYLVSDRAKALIQLAEHGLECLSMPDFFHCMHDLVKSYSFVIGQRVRHAQQELTKAQADLGTTPGTAPQQSRLPPQPRRGWKQEHSRGETLGRGTHDLSGPT